MTTKLRSRRLEINAAANFGTVSRLTVRLWTKVVRFGDRAQHSTGIYGPKFSQVQFSYTIANVIDTDFVVALAGAGSGSFDERYQRDPRICTEPIAIDGLHE